MKKKLKHASEMMQEELQAFRTDKSGGDYTNAPTTKKQPTPAQRRKVLDKVFDEIAEAGLDETSAGYTGENSKPAVKPMGHKLPPPAVFGSWLGYAVQTLDTRAILTAATSHGKKTKKLTELSKSVGHGLRRAARSARRTAQLHGTPLCVLRGGKVVEIDPYTGAIMNKKARSKKSEIKAKVDLYLKIVEWSDEDKCFIGRVPGLTAGGVHGDDEVAVFRELCQVAEEWVSDLMTRGEPLPVPNKYGAPGPETPLIDLPAATKLCRSVLSALGYRSPESIREMFVEIWADRLAETSVVRKEVLARAEAEFAAAEAKARRAREIKAGIRQGEKEVRQGKVLTQTAAKKRLKKWLK
jgi:predicted RNase H-like HicB family nuclease